MRAFYLAATLLLAAGVGGAGLWVGSVFLAAQEPSAASPSAVAR